MEAVLAASHDMLATADVAGKQADAHKAFLISLGEQRDWSLCRGCPALRGLCSGPGALDGGVEAGGQVVEL